MTQVFPKAVQQTKQPWVNKIFKSIDANHMGVFLKGIGSSDVRRWRESSQVEF